MFGKEIQLWCIIVAFTIFCPKLVSAGEYKPHISLSDLERRGGDKDALFALMANKIGKTFVAGNSPDIMRDAYIKKIRTNKRQLTVEVDVARQDLDARICCCCGCGPVTRVIVPLDQKNFVIFNACSSREFKRYFAHSKNNIFPRTLGTPTD